MALPGRQEGTPFDKSDIKELEEMLRNLRASKEGLRRLGKDTSLVDSLIADAEQHLQNAPKPKSWISSLLRK